MSDTAPFAELTPARVQDAIEHCGFACDGRVLALNSYENRVFRVGIEGSAPIVAKFYRPGRWSDAAILEEHGFAAELAAAELSVAAPLPVRGQTLLHVEGHRIALFALLPGRAPELDQQQTLTQLGQTLARIHRVGERTDFVHRRVLDPETFGYEPVEALLQGGWLPPELETPFIRLTDALFDHIERLWDIADEVDFLRLHGDCHPGNILWREGRAHFVDLDDCLSGPAIQDLWMLLSGNAEDQRRQWRWLMDGYASFRDFDTREIALVEALRTLRLLHFHGWVARRWDDPAFPAAFPWFEARRHWEALIAQLQEQLGALQEPVRL